MIHARGEVRPQSIEAIRLELTALRKSVDENREETRKLAETQRDLVIVVSNAKFGLKLMAILGTFFVGAAGVANVVWEWMKP